jgi:hypothetical protein
LVYKHLAPKGAKHARIGWNAGVLAGSRSATESLAAPSLAEPEEPANATKQITLVLFHARQTRLFVEAFASSVQLNSPAREHQ